ncbi:GHMP family kinase ATP-binding protein [Streptomyces varsoviensis]|uniref:GHMP family kinase ATP-binding protein n=1 Tax=Streptomyces varsoviensis TaxID=67373 RepID=UPI001FE0132E|nr:hypothetical protein [Streptomyces varsoviensis]
MTTRTNTRACLAGEDLDWLGYRSVCVAADLPTRVRVLPAGAGEPGEEAEAEATAVWNAIRRRLPHVDAERPAVAIDASAPLASGLSSSSSLIIGLFRTFARHLDLELDGATLLQWAYDHEYAIYHGGGMDQTSIIAGGATLTEGRDGSVPVLTGCVPFPEDWTIVVIDSATPKCTSRHLADVRRQHAQGDPTLRRYIAAADGCAEKAWSAVVSADLTLLGEAMTEAHTAMRDIQHMSSEVLEDMRRTARRTVGLPVKITGAGGGGSMIGVCRSGDAAEIRHLLSRHLHEEYPHARVLLADAAPLTGDLRAARPQPQELSA